MLISCKEEPREQDRPHVDNQSLLLDLFAQFPQALVIELGLGEEVGSDDDLLSVRAWSGEARRKGRESEAPSRLRRRAIQGRSSR